MSFEAEVLRSELLAWRLRQTWTKPQVEARMAAEDAVNDILAGRIKPGQITAQEVINRDA